jgi:hypothetical protein
MVEFKAHKPSDSLAIGSHAEGIGLTRIRIIGAYSRGFGMCSSSHDSHRQE